MSDAQSVGPFDNTGGIVREIRIRSRYTNEGFACRCREQFGCGLINCKDHRWRPIESPVPRVRNIQGREDKS